MLRALALALTVATGFSGLVYEVTWQKYLATLVGSDSEATAAVLGLFLGGLAAGYALFGAWTRRRVSRGDAARRAAPLLRVYGGLEAAIGLYALAFPTLFALAQRASLAVPSESGGFAFVFDVGLSALLIGPPAVLMGSTIPILTQALSRGLDDATRFHALVYGFNTAGAFAGALAAGFWLLPQLGLVDTLRAMAGVNLCAGAVFLGLSRAHGVASAPSGVERTRVAGFAALAAVAGLTGFAMMTLQTALIRLGGLSLGSSEFTFSMVVAAFVLCIALGSLAVSALPRVPSLLLPVALWALVALLGVLYLRLDDAPYWAHRLRSGFASEPAAFTAYYAAAFGALLAAIGLPVAISGATLPLLFHELRREVSDLGDVAGRLYSWNTVGSLLGALLGGYALLAWLDLHHVYRLAMLALAAAAAGVTAWSGGPARRRAAALLLVPAVIATLALPAWDPQRLASGLYRQRRATEYTRAGADAFFARVHRRFTLSFYDDDPVASIAVRSQRRPDGALHRSIYSNGKSDGAVPEDYVTMALAALVPALLAERAERAFVIGYGTGVTAGEFAALDSAREVVVAEISPGVIEAAPLFDESNLYASQNPRVRIVRGDAYRTLLRGQGRYDVIASEPSNPWVTGVEMLYSREFLQAARDRLRPGGVYAQWFHLYATDADTVALVLRTYASVFDHVAVWFAMGPDLLLLGVLDPAPALDSEHIAARAQRRDFAAGLRRCRIDGVTALFAHELLPLGVVHALALPGPVHSLLRPLLNHRAGRAFSTLR